MSNSSRIVLYLAVLVATLGGSASIAWVLGIHVTPVPTSELLWLSTLFLGGCAYQVAKELEAIRKAIEAGGPRR
jgi:hypothetical protein